MSLPTVPGILLTAGSVVIAYIASWLKSDTLPARTNLIIGWLAVVILVAFGLLLTGNFTSNIGEDIVLGAVTASALGQQLITLLNQAHTAPSPLLPKAAQPSYKPLAAGGGNPTGDAQ